MAIMQHFPLCKAISREFLQKELEFCQEKLGAMLPRFQDCFPAANTEELVYPAEHENFEWTTSFFSGMLWLLYEHTGDPAYLPVLGSTGSWSTTQKEALGFCRRRSSLRPALAQWK